MKIKIVAYQSSWSGNWYWSIFIPVPDMDIPEELQSIFPKGKVFVYNGSEYAFNHARKEITKCQLTQ